MSKLQELRDLLDDVCFEGTSEFVREDLICTFQALRDIAKEFPGTEDAEHANEVMPHLAIVISYYSNDEQWQDFCEENGIELQ